VIIFIILFSKERILRMNTKRIRDYGISVGRMKTGIRNKITDVPGVKVGHSTIKNEENHTGVTVILPGTDNPFEKKYTAASYVHNGFGKSSGLVQIDELGTLETPIALTNTLNVGLVWDAVAESVIHQCEKDHVEVKSLNPVVGECNDSRINQILKRAVKEHHVLEAMELAAEDFAEGDVGAGAGTICYGLKGGIGSASRVITIDDHEYTIGVLVQSNFGATEDFLLNGQPAGQKILKWKQEEKEDHNPMVFSESDKGSIMTILATDLPVSHRQLKRIIRRTAVGIARTGGYTGHGSGEVMIGFTTANRIPPMSEGKLLTQTVIHENCINQAFQAAAEATNEAILNSMVCAESTRGIEGEIYSSLAEYLPALLAES
jgi:D-aminopeptidase